MTPTRLSRDSSSQRQTRRRSVESAAVAGIVFSITSVLALSLLRALPHQWDNELYPWRADDTNARALSLGLGLASVAAVVLLCRQPRCPGDGAERPARPRYLVAAVLFVVPVVYSPLGLAMPIFVFVSSVMILVHRRDEAGESDDGH